MNTSGFFVDWNGDTRPVDSPGDGYSCSPIINKVCEGEPYQSVDVIDSEGFVIYEAVYYPTLDDLMNEGVVINLFTQNGE